MKANKFGELRDALYERSPESRERVAEKVARLNEELGLAELRARTKHTQAQLADVIGTSQSGVSRLERQHDVLVSTLRDYVAATGGRLHLVAQYADYECEVHLPVLDEHPQTPRHPRAFRVVWQNAHTRQFLHVGWLEYTGSEFQFSYTPEAELDPDFEPFPLFADFRRTYRAGDLFPFFADRLISAARPDYDELITALGLTRQEATPVELLARSWGMSAHDAIQIVPEPVEHHDGTTVRLFLASGLRHVDESKPESVSSRIAALRRGQRLDLHDEPDNPRNENAIILQVAEKPVGWIPDYLLDEVRKLREAGRELSVVVEQANGPDAPWHLRLLCRLEVRPEASG